MTRVHQKTLLATAVITALAAPLAQAELEEVLVTAERREASVQDTPIAIQALSERMIEERGISSITDIFQQLAGVQGYTPPGTSSSPGFNIRGVGDGASTNLSLDPSTAKYIDGIYIGKAGGSGMDVADLQRIEILKGPQGTLFGRNSTGGAVNFISKAPGEEMGLDLRLSRGDYGYTSYSGRADVPLNDHLRLALSGYSRQRDPIYGNTNPEQEGFQDMDREGGRIALQFTPNDWIQLDWIHTEDTVDELDPMLDIVGLNPGYGPIATQAGLGGNLNNIPINSRDRIDGQVQPIVDGLGATLSDVFFGTDYLQLGAYGGPQIQSPFGAVAQQYLEMAQGWIDWANEELANYGKNPGVGSSDGPSYALTETRADTFKATFQLSDSMELRYIWGRRDVTVEDASDIDGMDNSWAHGNVGEYPALYTGSALFASVRSPLVPGFEAYGLDGSTFAPGFLDSSITLNTTTGLYEFPVGVVPGLGNTTLQLTPDQLDMLHVNLANDMISAVRNYGGGVFSTRSFTDYVQESNEIQLVGSTETLDWAVGAYFFTENGSSENLQIATIPVASTNSTAFDHKADNFSVFGEATYRPENSPWAFTAGLRYTEETKEIVYKHRGFDNDTQSGIGGWITQWTTQQITALYEGAGFIPEGSAAAVAPTEANLMAGYVFDLEDLETIPELEGVYGRKFKKEFDNISYRLVAQYDFNDDANGYISYTTGYKSGGFNGAFFDTAGDNADAFDEETIASLELGYKATLADGRLRVDTAVFRYEYDDLQVSTVETRDGTVSSQLDNSGSATREGFELNAAWQATDSLQLRLGYAFLTGGFDDYPSVNVCPQPNTIPGAPCDLPMQPKNAISPENSVQAAFDWDMGRLMGGDLNLQVNANYQDATVSIATAQGVYDAPQAGLPSIPMNFEQAVNHSRTLVDARLSWDVEIDETAGVTVALWGRNLLDEDYRTFGFNFGPALGLPVHQWGVPATYGIDVNMKF